MAVHPRSRGEHDARGHGIEDVAGSSPLARGTPASRRRWKPAFRFIPARAGNTRPCSPTTSPPPVHPRSRGEHAALGGRRTAAAGSSPLARGTLREIQERHAEGRFIPARAGNTAPGPSLPACGPVHPRSRGEHRAMPGLAYRLDGSSPLARGTPVHALPAHGWDRFIPARAGNTRRCARARPRGSVHPRSRGEHDSGTPDHRAPRGSSPLARGTHAITTADILSVRFIPARAGNT